MYNVSRSNINRELVENVYIFNYVLHKKFILETKHKQIFEL